MCNPYELEFAEVASIDAEDWDWVENDIEVEPVSKS
jgi:hypothetical protein